MPVGEFRKALLQVRWVLAAAGSECVRMRVRMHTHARVCVCMCMFVSIKVCYVHIPTLHKKCDHVVSACTMKNKYFFKKKDISENAV